MQELRRPEVGASDVRAVRENVVSYIAWVGRSLQKSFFPNNGHTAPHPNRRPPVTLRVGFL